MHDCDHRESQRSNHRIFTTLNPKFLSPKPLSSSPYCEKTKSIYQPPHSKMIGTLVFYILVCLHSVAGHLSDTCPSVIKNRDIFTRRGTNYGDTMYFWTATYPHGSGCYQKNWKKLYFRTHPSSFQDCNGLDGDGVAVIWDDGTTSHWSDQVTSGNTDQPLPRPHCNTNINFQKLWHRVGKSNGGFRLPGPTDASSDAPLYVTMCFSGFLCESIQVGFQYKVYKGCNKGFYEDTSITWPKNTVGGIANPEYCVKCPVCFLFFSFLFAFFFPLVSLFFFPLSSRLLFSFLVCLYGRPANTKTNVTC